MPGNFMLKSTQAFSVLTSGIIYDSLTITLIPRCFIFEFVSTWWQFVVLVARLLTAVYSRLCSSSSSSCMVWCSTVGQPVSGLIMQISAFLRTAHYGMCAGPVEVALCMACVVGPSTVTLNRRALGPALGNYHTPAQPQWRCPGCV